MKYKRLILFVVVLSFLVFIMGCQNGDSDVRDLHPSYAKYILTLNPNGGAIPEGNIIEFYAGERVDLPQPFREGYKFEGWYSNSSFTGVRYYYLDEKYTYSNYELWAKWIKLEDSQGNTEGQTYAITYVLNGGHFENGATVDSYVSGGKKILPVPVCDGYKFLGWYENRTFSGNPVTEIDENSSGDKIFYALWQKLSDEEDNPPVDHDEPKIYTINYELNGGKFSNGSYIPLNYRYGDEFDLPVPEREGFGFEGWFDNDALKGAEISKITSNDCGNKFFYAKWAANKENLIKIKSYGGYKESAYVEVVPVLNLGTDGYSVEYRENGAVEWQKTDNELIRFINGVIRADILGLKAGNYSIKIEAAGDCVTLTDVTVAAYERTGGAFNDFMASSLGGYNLDGTVRKDAEIIYVTEENKNSVQLKIGDITYTGIAGIFSAFKNADKPLIVRFIGQVSAASWNKLEYNSENIYNGKRLLGAMSQEELIQSSYNTLDEENYSELNGLVSKIKYADGQFDSYWNMCETSGAKNVTIEGVGTDAVIMQWGFAFIDCKSIEVRNLTFRDYPENACLFAGSQKIWVHDNNFERGKNNWNVSPENSKVFGDGHLVFSGVSDTTDKDNGFPN